METKVYTNDALTRKRWADGLMTYILKESEYGSLVGPGKDSIVVSKTELSREGSGDTITIGLLKPLVGEGIVGDKAWRGNEERSNFSNFSLTIEELGHAVETGGIMEHQRVPYNLVEEAKGGLSDWWIQKISDIVINHLVGDSRFKVGGVTFAQDPVEPDANHMYIVNGKAAEVNLTANDKLEFHHLRALYQKAMTITSTNKRIRPIMVNGKPMFRVILSQYVYDQLRTSANVGDWMEFKTSADNIKEEIKKYDFEIEFENMLISRTSRITPHTDSAGTTNVWRGVLLGAQAACIAWGGAGKSIGTALNFSVEPFDHGRRVSIASGGVFGVKKTRFDNEDYGAITFASWAKPLEVI